MDDGHSPARRGPIGLVLVFVALVASATAWLQLVEGSDRPFIEDFYRILMLFAIEGDWVFEEDHGPAIKIFAFLAPVFTVFTVIQLVTRDFVHRLVLAWQLHWVKNHFILAGLTEESFLVAKSLHEHPSGFHAVVIDANPPQTLKAASRRLGIPIIVGDPSDPEVLIGARVDLASSVISFLSNAAEAIRLILAINAVVESKIDQELSLDRGGTNVWIKLDDISFGLALGEYFKLPDVAAHVQPRFFSLDEVAARRLVRFHAPDIYADAFGQERIHIAIYGFNRLAIEIIKAVVVQSVTKCEFNPRFTILDEDPAETESALLAQLPQFLTLTDVEFRKLHAYDTGIADNDYDIIPQDATIHVVCYESPEKATSTGLSLRRLSLAPPPDWDNGMHRRLNAPVFVRLTQWKGLAQFLGSSVERPAKLDMPLYRDRDIPDGLFAFGMIDDLLSADDLDAFIPTIIDTPREEIAKHIHFSYLQDRESLSSKYGGEAGLQRRAELNWNRLAPEYRESCRQGADHIWTKARVIHSRIVRQNAIRGNKKNTVGNLGVSETERQALAIIEHRRWLNERILSGWTYNEKRVDFARRHDLLRPWEEIPEADARLDLAMPERLQAGIQSIGLDLKRELVIGVIGHRNRPDLYVETDFVRNNLRKELDSLLKEHPDKTPVILTSLADGADSIAAEIAIEKGIPYIAILPLPFEAYRQDFDSNSDNAGNLVSKLERFMGLVGRAERYLEMPLKFGDLISVSALGDAENVPVEREKQYALAAAYIVERADELIGIWDGQPPKGIGGTGGAIGWRFAGRVPSEFASNPVFYDRPAIKPPIIIPPHPEGS